MFFILNFEQVQIYEMDDVFSSFSLFFLIPQLLNLAPILEMVLSQRIW